MENIREIIAKNLVILRKENNLTQIKLAQKINFSDKAVSRWEKGEVLPDIETLYKLSEIYSVPISSILEEHENVNKSKFVKPAREDVLAQIFLICEIWVIIGVIYAYLNLSMKINLWQIFLWGIPATALFLIIKNKNNKNNNIITFFCGTIFVWSFITSLFILMLNSNPWYFFLLGIPIQGMLIVRYLFNFKGKSKLIINRKKQSKSKFTTTSNPEHQ
jgi:transcriptional regulator with XRE-family HTH domain